MENNITSEVLKRVDTVGSKIEDVIKVLAEKIGVGAEHFWPIFVKQQYVDGLTSIIVWTIPFIVCAVLVYVFLKMHIKQDDIDNYYDGAWLYAAIPIGCITFLLLICMLIELSDAIPKMLNPEYYAFKEIMNMIK